MRRHECGATSQSLRVGQGRVREVNASTTALMNKCEKLLKNTVEKVDVIERNGVIFSKVKRSKRELKRLNCGN